MFDYPEFILVAVVGGVVGLISGVFGVGGGFLLVPVLNVVVGIPIEIAVGSSVCQVLGPATTALLARRLKPRELRFPLMLTGGMFCGVFAAGQTLLALQRASGRAVPGGAPRLIDVVLLFGYLVLLGLLLLITLADLKRGSQESVLPGPLARITLNPSAMLPEFDFPISIAVLGWYGFVVGFVSGLLGISGGLILWPSLLFLWGLSTQLTIRVTLLSVWILSAQGTLVHAFNGFVNLELVAALLVGGTLGARIGAEFSPALRPRQLRKGFAALVAAAGMLVVYRLATLLS